jgi:putative transposase
MLRFRKMKSLQKFASVHANIYNHFGLEGQLIALETYKQTLSRPG